MIITHCLNCTPKHDSRLPDSYQRLDGKVVDIHSDGKMVYLCPRCKCPEVMYEDTNFQPSYGYNNGGMIDSRKNSK